LIETNAVPVAPNHDHNWHYLGPKVFCKCVLVLSSAVSMTYSYFTCNEMQLLLGSCYARVIYAEAIFS